MSASERHPGAKRIAVYCSASSKLEPEFFTEANLFAEGMVQRGWELIYGGAKVGLMGRFADRCLELGGVARGSITKKLAEGYEVAHPNLTELVVVDDLFDRKRWMNDLGDAFVLFPGGLGTLDEALEVLTWKSLGYHAKPIIFVNIAGFWQNQIHTFQEMAKRGVIHPGGFNLYHVTETASETLHLLDRLSQQDGFGDELENRSNSIAQSK
jgi:uncharacterized protein (TIGR00730 family)